jgi:hypothetical protein
LRVGALHSKPSRRLTRRAAGKVGRFMPVRCSICPWKACDEAARRSQRPSASRYEQIERDLQGGGNGRELPGRAAASAALEICNVALTNASSIGQRDLGYPPPVTNNPDRILASRDAIGDGLRNGNLPTLVECAACSRDEAAGACILFGFGGERGQALVLLAGEHREFIPMRGPDKLHLGHGAVSILVDLATVADRHDNNSRRVLSEDHAPVADAQTGALAPLALYVAGARPRITDKLIIDSLVDPRGELCPLSRGRDGERDVFNGPQYRK